MKILITNDDGISSPVFSFMKKALAEHEVWIVAPDRERSGCSNSISLHSPVKFTHLGERSYSCSGTPADCVLYSLLGALPVKPDLVLSGINLGPNLGTDLIYSGTAAGARQAALLGVPAVAFSMNQFKPPYPMAETSKFIAENVSKFCEICNDDSFLNINFPEIINEMTEIRYTIPGLRVYTDVISSHPSADGNKFYFLSGSLDHSVMEDGSDWEAVEQGHISVSKIMVHPVGMENISHPDNLGLIIPT